MKILFVGVPLSEGFEKLLFASGFTFDSVKTLAEADKQKDTDLAVVRFTANLSPDLDEYLKANPRCYLAPVISTKDLQNKNLHNALLSADAKHAVWLLETWESLFWFNLQAFFQWRVQNTKHFELEQNFIQLEQKTQSLTQSTNDLIDQFEKDLLIAEGIQRTLLPRVSPEIPGISLAVKYVPSGGLGGDYYDIFEFGDKKRFGILVADSKTHGMAAALLGILLKIRLEELKERFPNSKAFVTHLNQELAQTAGGAKAPMNLLYGIVDRSTLQFTYTTAGDIKPLLWRTGGMVSAPPMQQPSMGSVTQFDYQETTLQLRPGDLLLLHTDGLEAPFQVEGPSFDQRLEEILQGLDSVDPLRVQNEILALLNSIPEELPDDVTFIQIAIKEKTLYLAQNKDRA